METSTKFILSDYQQAILNEMGISCWARPSEKNKISEVSSNHKGPMVEQKAASKAVSSQPLSKDSAIAKLALMKQAASITTKQETTDLLLAFNVSPALSMLFDDVLLILDLQHIKQKKIQSSQLSEYAEFSFYWEQGGEIRLVDNCLTTPPLDELRQAKYKKQLWKTLQQYKKS